MANLLPTQEKSSEKAQSYHDLKTKTRNAIRDNLNYIYIVLMIIANCIVALLKIEDGKVGLHYPHDALGWVLWAAQILITTFIGVMILNAFRRQGIKNGHGMIKEIYNQYMKLLAKANGQELHPRSLKQYLRKEATKDSVFKAAIYIILNTFVMSVAISANLNGLLALVVTTIFAVGFGIKSMMDAEEYVITELVVWYQLEIKKMEEFSNGQQVQRNLQPRPRHGESSRIQPKKECGTRQEN